MNIFKKALTTLTASAMVMSATISSIGALGTADAAGSQSAIDLVNDMGLGWNLGNTFDAWSASYTDGSCPADKYETIWGNSKTTQAMISEIHKYGFNSVRIPVTFYKCTDPSTYDISDDYLARVKEVVDYCVNEDMYAIIDMHWDWVSPSDSGNPTLWLNKGLDSEAQFKAMWTEIANYFKSYDNHVVFQDMNEVWWGDNYTSSSSKSYTVLNTLNQDFVDVVRATGGNNSNRLLLLAGANADLTKTISSAYKVPDDKMVAVDIHYYTPPTFCVAPQNSSWGYTSTWGTAAEKAAVVTDFNKLKSRFVDNNIPVIIGEYGVLTSQGKDVSSIEAFVETVAGTAYSMNGISGFLWDDSDAGGHEYFSRNNLKWWNDNIGAIYSKISNTGYTAPTIDWVETEITEDEGVLKFQVGNSTRIKLVFDSQYAKTMGAGGTLSYWDTVSNTNKQNAVSISVTWNDMTGELLANELGEADEDGNQPVVNTGFISIPGDVAPANAYINLYWAGYNEMNGDEWVAWHNLDEADYPTLVKVYIDGVVEEPEETTTTTEATTTTTTVTTTTTTEESTTTTTTEATTTAEKTTTSKAAETSTETTTATETTKPVETSGTAEDILYGDANGDSKVNMADAVFIMQCNANPGEFQVADENKAAADVSGNGDGITNNDALAIQRFEAGIVKALPVA